MRKHADGSISIQTSSRSSPAPPPWFGEVVLLSSHLRKQGVLDAISEQVRFARRRFGQFEVIDFVAVLFGYAIIGERTLQACYERLQPWASAFMALFGRGNLPSRSALSRWLAALTGEPAEALRACFLADLLARPLGIEEPLGGVTDRAGTRYLIFDVDGTREAARQRSLPKTADRPTAQRRLRPLCAPGYLGRKHGEVVRTHHRVPPLSEAWTVSMAGSCHRQTSSGAGPEKDRKAEVSTRADGKCSICPLLALLCDALQGLRLRVRQGFGLLRPEGIAQARPEH